MKKRISLILILAGILSMSGCEKGYFGAVGVLLSPARDISGYWEGTLTSCLNEASNPNPATHEMTLDLELSGNDVTGTMTYGPYSGSLTGTISGVNIDFTTFIGNGCINVHGTFTSTNMEGMKNSNPPPYLQCGVALNSGNGTSKGLEWHLQKK